MKANKKGQVSTIQALLSVLFILCFVIGITFLIYDKYKENLSDTSATVTDELITPVNGTAVWLDKNASSINCYDDLSISVISNLTAYELTVDNYSVGTVGTITASSEVTNAQDRWYVNYTYTYGNNEACVAVEESTDAIADIPGWFVIIVLVIIAGVIFYYIFAIAGTGRKSGSSSAEI